MVLSNPSDLLEYFNEEDLPPNFIESGVPRQLPYVPENEQSAERAAGATPPPPPGDDAKKKTDKEEEQVTSDLSHSMERG